MVEGNILEPIVAVGVGIDRSAGGIGGPVVGIGGGPDASHRRIGTIPIAINWFSFGASCGAAGVIDVEGFGIVAVTGNGAVFGLVAMPSSKKAAVPSLEKVAVPSLEKAAVLS